jgi:hypothetical protein
VRSASPPLLPNGWAAAAGAGSAPRVAGRCADAAWRDVAPAARPQSAVMRGGEAWAWRAPLSFVTVTFPGRIGEPIWSVLYLVFVPVLCAERERPFFVPVACSGTMDSQAGRSPSRSGV